MSASYADRDKWERRGHHERPSRDVQFEQRFEPRHSYPREGHIVRVLPHKHRPIHYHNKDFFYLEGVWYLSSGVDFVVVRPPLGIIVPILPPFYTTIWVGDIPYYFANGVYYQWRGDINGYEVVEFPVPEEKQSDLTYMADKLFIYPKKGQSEEQQSEDRFTCHQFGVEQTGYDPSQPPQDDSVEQLRQKRKNYQEAMKACLEGKGYSVR